MAGEAGKLKAGRPKQLAGLKLSAPQKRALQAAYRDYLVGSVCARGSVHIGERVNPLVGDAFTHHRYRVMHNTVMSLKAIGMMKDDGWSFGGQLTDVGIEWCKALFGDGVGCLGKVQR